MNTPDTDHRRDEIVAAELEATWQGLTEDQKGLAFTIASRMSLQGMAPQGDSSVTAKATLLKRFSENDLNALQQAGLINVAGEQVSFRNRSGTILEFVLNKLPSATK